MYPDFAEDKMEAKRSPKPQSSRTNAAGAYLAVLADAVHGVLITAEFHRVDLSAVGLPAHSTLMLLHV